MASVRSRKPGPTLVLGVFIVLMSNFVLVGWFFITGKPMKQASANIDPTEVDNWLTLS